MEGMWRTLLFVPRLSTTSLCTFRLRNLPLSQSFAARNTAASTCVVERIYKVDPSNQSITIFKRPRKCNGIYAQHRRQRTRTQSRNFPAAIGRGGKRRSEDRCRVRCGPLGQEGGVPGAGFGVLPFWVGDCMMMMIGDAQCTAERRGAREKSSRSSKWYIGIPPGFFEARFSRLFPVEEPPG